MLFALVLPELSTNIVSFARFPTMEIVENPCTTDNSLYLLHQLRRHHIGRVTAVPQVFAVGRTIARCTLLVAMFTTLLEATPINNKLHHRTVDDVDKLHRHVSPAGRLFDDAAGGSDPEAGKRRSRRTVLLTWSNP